MDNNNKKLWSFIVGCILCSTYLWLVEIGLNAQVPTSLYGDAKFIVSLYPMLVTSSLAILLSIALVLFMPKLAKIRASDHLFWLIIPSLSFLCFSAATNHVLFLPMLSAALPTIAIIFAAYMIEKRDMYLPERSKVW